MDERVKRGLALGGSMDGRTVVAKGEYFLAALPRNTVATYDKDQQRVPDKKEDVPADRYRSEQMRTQNDVYWFWVLEGMTIDDALQRLIAGYRPPN